MTQAKSINIVLAGEAGQGLATAGEMLSTALVRGGFHISVTQDYMSRIRGGSNSFSVRISDAPVEAPSEQIDILIAFSEDSIDRYGRCLTDGGLLICSGKHSPAEHNHTVFSVPYGDLSKSRLHNTLALGVLWGLFELQTDWMEQSLNVTFSGKDDVLQTNLDDFKAAFEWAGSNRPTLPEFPKADSTGRRMLLKGNQAIALGALSGGLRFCSFYPMTPATSIILTLIKHADEADIVTEQAEDEIAAINMALGAAYAGAPAMVATSGGGYALMTEGVSLSGITEVPVVIAIAQRPGPATGLPTRTEQGDLSFVLHGGHGEFPRILYAPGTIQECYDLTRRAFQQAHKHQIPVFVITDQYLADSYRDVDVIDAQDVEPLSSGKHEGAPEDYKRYAITESGISPRLFPGRTEALVVTDSDEHDEKGHITEDLELRIRMSEKRLRKQDGIRDESLAPTFIGDENPDMLLVCWGSTRGAACEAAEQLRAEGKRTAILHFAQVWPLVPEQFLEKLQSADRVIGIEGNANAQFAKLLRGETGFYIEETVLRYDGLPITVQTIIEGIKS
jgi:2-oxoglutarate/2-oxoacid ferredoxin oxidoreductase subunit alpha